MAWGAEVRKNGGLLVCFDTWAGDLAQQMSEAWREVMGWQVSHNAVPSCVTMLCVHPPLLMHHACQANAGQACVFTALVLLSSQRSRPTQLAAMLLLTAAAQACSAPDKVFLLISRAHGLQEGHAHLYERFLNRIIQADLTQTVLPVRAASPVAARMMGVLNYTVDAVYLDSAQEGGELYLDLSLYWDLLRPGGVLMGDDYMWFWPGVIHDVDLFMKHSGIPTADLMFSKDWDYWNGKGTWAIKKPDDYIPAWQLHSGDRGVGGDSTAAAAAGQ